MPISGQNILLYEKSDGVVTITLNRPERQNAVSWELQRRLADAWVQFRDDDDARVAILTGAGDKTFCTGADLVEQSETDEREGKAVHPELLQMCPVEIWKPIIAAVNGYAIAGGFWLAKSCDIRIASENAEFGIAESKWNMPAFWIHDLTAELSIAHALEIALWGDRRISAQRAYEMGFVNKVVPRDKLMDEAMSWADSMRYLAPRCVRNFKQIIRRGRYLSYADGEAFAKALENNLIGMEDTIEGPRAFAEKRKPVFKDK